MFYLFTVEKDLEGVNGTHLVGNQPEGEMTLEHERRSLPGYPKDDTIKINFVFPDGIQTVSLNNWIIVKLIKKSQRFDTKV